MSDHPDSFDPPAHHAREPAPPHPVRPCVGFIVVFRTARAYCAVPPRQSSWVCVASPGRVVVRAVYACQTWCSS
eukprot:3301463-Rhodomonas_salina.1